MNKLLLIKIQEQAQLTRIVKAANDSSKLLKANKLVTNSIIKKL